MSRWVWALLAFLIAGAIFLATDTGLLFSDVESKGSASEITEWVKLAISVVSLLIGIVNLRIALAKSKSG